MNDYFFRPETGFFADPYLKTGPFDGYIPPCYDGPTNPYLPNSASLYQKIIDDIEKDIRNSENPYGTLLQYIVWLTLFENFARDGITRLSLIGGELREIQHSKHEEKDRKEVRGDDQKSYDNGNSGYKEGSVESNC